MTDENDKDLTPDAENPEEKVVSAESEEGSSEDVSDVAAEGEASASPAADDVAAAVAEAKAKAESGDDDAAVAEAKAASGDVNKVVNPDDVPEDDAEDAMLKMLEDLPDQSDMPSPADIDFGSASVSSAEFQQLQEPVSSAEASNIDLLMDVDLPVSIELGRTKMPISDILGLGPGSVVELNKLAGEPVDLLVNYKVVAKGEVVVVDENFGLRITQLMTPEERLKALAEE